MRYGWFLAAIFLFAGGCSFAFFSRPCAIGPEDAVEKLFAAFTSTDYVSSDIEKPPGIKESLNIKKIMRVAPDPRALLASMGRGDSKKGWEEFLYLKGLAVFYGTSKFEFQEYTAFVDSVVAIPQKSGGSEKYQFRITRVDTLLDMHDDNNTKEIKRSYVRNFTGEFSRGSYCIVSMTPRDEWREMTGNEFHGRTN